MHECAWEEGPDRRMEISRWLFNPFYYMAGAKALVVGLLTLMLTGIFGFLGRTRFDGILDFHMGLPPLPAWGYVTEIMLSWVLLSILLFLAGKMISKSRPRLIDVLGTQALARFPYLLVALMALMPGAKRFTLDLLNGTALWNQFSTDLVVFLIVVGAGLVMLVWMVALMYRAFAVSCNVSGAVAVAVFVVALVVGEIVSKILIYYLFPISIVA